MFVKSITFRMRWKPKEKLVLVFGLHLPLDLINLFNVILLFDKSFLTIPGIISSI